MSREVYTDWRLLLVGFKYEDKDGNVFQVRRPVMNNPPYFEVMYLRGTDPNDAVVNSVVEDNSSGPWTMVN